MGRQIVTNPKLVEKKKVKARTEVEKRLKKLAKLEKRPPEEQLLEVEEDTEKEANSIRSKGSSEGSQTAGRSALKPLEMIERKLVQTLRIGSGRKSGQKSKQPSFSHFVAPENSRKTNATVKLQQKNSTVGRNVEQMRSGNLFAVFHNVDENYSLRRIFSR